MRIDEFCDKFCKPFDIYHFIYIEIFFNGWVDTVSNHNSFLDIYVDKKFPFSFELNSMINTSSNRNLFFLWPNNTTEDLPKLLNELLIFNGITVVEKTDNSFRTFAFATDQFHDNFSNFFINNLDILKKIKNQFWGEYNNDNCCYKKTFFTSPLLKLQNVSADIEKVHFDNFISINNKIISISDKRMEILQQLSRGKSSKEIANILNISMRTVDKQIELLMQQTGVHSRKLLIKAFNDDI